MSTVTNNEAGLPVLEHRAGPVIPARQPRQERLMAQSTPPEEPLFFLPGPSTADDQPRTLRTIVMTGDPIEDFIEFLNRLDDFAQEQRLYAFLREHLPLLAACREIEDEQAARDFGSES